MPTIPPSLPLSYGNHFNPIDPTDAKLVNELKTDWDNWFKNPTIENAKKLLNFMKDHAGQIEAIAKNYPLAIPLGTTPIARALQTAINNLQAWIDHGGNTPPNPDSEWVKDVYDWISYRG